MSGCQSQKKANKKEFSVYVKIPDEYLTCSKDSDCATILRPRCDIYQGSGFTAFAIKNEKKLLADRDSYCKDFKGFAYCAFGSASSPRPPSHCKNKKCVLVEKDKSHSKK